MKKKSASKSAFFNLRVLIGLCIALVGVSLALVALDAFAANGARFKIKNHIITASNDPLVPVGFDCSKIEELNIHKMENFRAGAIMIACGADENLGPSSVGAFFQRVGQGFKKLLVPLYGAGDVDVINHPETPPNIVQSETYTTVNPDNPQQIVVAFNDSRGRNASPINISGGSVSTDGGATFDRLTCTAIQNGCVAIGQGPFSNTTGDPVVLYNKPTSTWFTVWIGDGACAGGLGGFKSTTPWIPESWTHYPCVNSSGGGNDDRESGWADNNPSSPFFGRMYVSWNNFGVGGGAIQVTRSTDNGNTWSAPVNVTSSFIRNVQITGDKVTGDVYVAGMDENAGNGCTSGCGTNRNNKIYRSTDGGVTFTNTYTGPAFVGPCRSSSGFFCTMYSTPAYWRHMGWGEPAAFNHVVSLVYAQKDGTDPGNVYYIRSTDSGLTFSAPFQLNANTDPTKAQWQPNLSVSEAGTLFATWYDEAPRTSASCQPSSPANLCYQMHSRKSPDNGLTWLADETLSDVASPLPLQNDPGIQPTYVGDYDYGSAVLTKHATSWADGRVPIGGLSQQDVFTDRDLVGFAVTTSTPACNSIVSTQPTDFIINLTDPVNTATVQASDFTVNGIAANTVAFSNGNATLTFHFNTSPVSVQGPQTMNIPANAFNRASDNQGNFAFNCTFCYAITPLAVTTTVPPVGGTFTPPAPGNYNYDVNFNQAVDPASVQDSDLMVSGNSGPSVTGHSLLNGNTTVRFNLHMNFGGTLTATLGAAAVTANTCNGNAAFTGNYTVQGCPPADHYVIGQIGGSIVPGTTDIGNHTDDGDTFVSLPFTFQLYGNTYTGVNVGSNGHLDFVTINEPGGFTNSCLPATPNLGPWDFTIFPYWDDLRTDAGTWTCTPGPCGIYTSVSGTAPNRIFNIEWRTVYYNAGSGTGNANFEARLYEGQSRFDVIYGNLTNSNTSATAGVQKSNTAFDQYFCNGSGGAATGGQSYVITPCGSPTPTPTGTPSATPTTTASATATPTAPATATPTVPATATPTASPSCSPNYTFASGTGTIVPGVTDTGNHCDDCSTAVSLPFPVSLYGTSYTSASVGSNGHFTFGVVNDGFTLSCMPVTPGSDVLGPYWRDQRTDAVGGCTGCGIFTTTTGTAPNRVFRVEYRTIYFGQTSATPTLNYEVNLYENGSPVFDFTYGLVTTFSATGRFLTVGVEHNATSFTQFGCDPTGGTNPPVATGQKLTATLQSCGSPTPTPTPTTTATASCTPGWSAGAPLPTPGVRAVGVYFPANGKFYAMGGRSADTAGSDFTHPFEYNPATNTWVTKAATYADNQVNNMACAVLTDAGTPYIYCVGGSAATQATATDRVFRYNPVTDTISPVAAPWPGAMGTILPGGFSVFNNKLYILGGFNNPVGMVDTIYEFTPNPAGWVLKSAHLPAPRGYIPTTTIGNFIYTGGGSMFDPTLIIADAADSFRYDPVADSIITIASIPRATGETRALNVNGQMYVMGGGRTAPNPSSEVDIYNPGTNTWSIGTPFTTARRNFPTDTDGTNRIWLAGGYAPSTPTDSMEIFGICTLPTPTPTVAGTPSATPTCIPGGGTPGPWTQAAPVAIDHYGGFIDSDGTVAYEGGGYSFTTSGTINQFGKFNPATNTWTPLAPVPDLINAEASGVYAPNVNKLFVFGGDDPTTGTVVNTTRIYDIATNTWSTGAPMPDVRAFMGSGYFNGKIYLVGGYTTGNVDPSFGQVWEYDPVANTFNTSRMSMPATLGGPGFGIINGHIYIAGGRNLANTNLNTLYDYDIAANTWTTRANMPSGVNVPGSAVIGGKLWVFGGGNPFLGSSTLPTSGQTGVRAWFKRLFNPDTTNALQVYDPATNSWTSGPTLNQQRSFPAGTDVGNTAVAVGGYTGSSTTASVEVNVTGGGGCGSPTPTPTGTPSATPTCTPGGAGQITTLFATNNNGSPGGAVYFDLTVAGNPITVTAFDINTDFTGSFSNFRVYVLPGMSFQGNETNMALWTQVATGSGTGAGVDQPTHVTLSNSIPLNAGTLYGIALVADPAFGHFYTNGTGSNQNYSNADLALFLGSATNVPFTAPVFSPRVWNGTIYYSTGSCGSPTPTPTGTPSATPTCTPGGSPGPWSTASPYPIPDVRYGFAQTATHFYVFGGVSDGTRVNNVNRLDLATGMWESRAAMPFTSEAPTCALMASTGIVYCTEGDTGSGFASYNIATNTWSSLASIPGGDHYGSASGAFNGKVFVAGGTTGFVSTVQVYDVATNTWSAGTAAPNDFLLAGYQQVGQFLYVVGGFEASGPVKPSAAQSSVLNRGMQSQQPKVPMANNTTTWRLDMSSAPGVWTTGPAFTTGRADFGLAYDAGTNKLYALGGDLPGGGFFDSTNAVDELSVASWPAGSWVASPPNLILPNRQANQAGFYGSGQIWSVGGLVGQTFQFLAEVQRRTNGGAPCGSPTATPTATPTPSIPTATPTTTPTATATATFTPTATATATSTATPTTTPTATATASPTVPPRPTPSPRPRPTPPPHVANCYNNDNCTGFPKSSQLTCADCLMSGGSSWVDSSGCHTTCP